jgi:hypothetical protein
MDLRTHAVPTMEWRWMQGMQGMQDASGARSLCESPVKAHCSKVGRELCDSTTSVAFQRRQAASMDGPTSQPVYKAEQSVRGAIEPKMSKRPTSPLFQSPSCGHIREPPSQISPCPRLARLHFLLRLIAAWRIARLASAGASASALRSIPSTPADCECSAPSDMVSKPPPARLPIPRLNQPAWGQFTIQLSSRM